MVHADQCFFLRFTKGRIGCKLGTQTILLLETVGRKSRQPRVIPIAYFFHEGKYLIVNPIGERLPTQIDICI